MNKHGVNKPTRWGRRVFLIGASVVGGGLAVGAGFIANKLSNDRAFKLPAADGAYSFGAWLTIDKNGKVTVAVPNQEMGQGIMTTIPMLVAEELDADPAQVSAVQAPVAAIYANPTMMLDGLPLRPDDHGMVANSVRWTLDKLLRALGVQATGGSTSTRNAWVSAREAGAAARLQLLTVAAARWNVAVTTLTVERGIVRDGKGKSASFAELVTDAAKLPLQAAPALKDASKFELIGTGMARTDVPAKTDGSAQFGIDVRLPGMKYAAIKHAPQFGGSVATAELSAKPSGVLALVNGGHFVAVIADNYWLAKTTLDGAKIQWQPGPNANVSSASIFASYGAALDGKSEHALVREYETRGDGAVPLASASKRIKAEYRVPFQAHATMEPLNCTVQIKDGACEVWVGNQAPTLVKWLAAGKAGVPSDKTTVHTPYLGGGFGRRAEADFIREAVEITKSANGAPVKTIWSREEDMQHDVYRPAVLSRFEAGLNDKGELVAWKNEIAGPSVMRQFTARIDPMYAGNMPDKTNAEGATFLPYDLPNLLVKHAQVEIPVPVGFWRSVGHSFNAFFVECFVDECAAAAGANPLQFRRQLLAGPRSGARAGDDAMAKRILKVLDVLAESSGWATPMKPVAGKRVGRGIAIAESFHSIVAQVAEVEVAASGEIRCTRVVAVVDCGTVVDPVIAKAQVASAVHFGLSAALYGSIDIEGGRVKQGNFSDFPVVTFATAPRVDVSFVNSGAALGGIGEVGTPPIAPAVANAVFAATGKRIRHLPLSFA